MDTDIGIEMCISIDRSIYMSVSQDRSCPSVSYDTDIEIYIECRYGSRDGILYASISRSISISMFFLHLYHIHIYISYSYILSISIQISLSLYVHLYIYISMYDLYIYSIRDIIYVFLDISIFICVYRDFHLFLDAKTEKD